MQKISEIANSVKKEKVWDRTVAGLPQEAIQRLLDNGIITKEEFVQSKSKIGYFELEGLTIDQVLKFRSNFDNDLFEFNKALVFHDIIGPHTAIGIVFEDFRAISFVRDMLLTKILETSFKYLALAIKSLKKAKINVEIVHFHFTVQFSEKLVRVDIMSNPEMIKEILNNIESYLTLDLVAEVRPLGHVVIRYNDRKKVVEVKVANPHCREDDEQDTLKTIS